MRWKDWRAEGNLVTTKEGGAICRVAGEPEDLDTREVGRLIAASPDLFDAGATALPLLAALSEKASEKDARRVRDAVLKLARALARARG